MSSTIAYMAESCVGPGFDALFDMCSAPVVGHSISTLSLIGQVSDLNFCNTSPGWFAIRCKCVVDAFLSAFVVCSGHDDNLYVMAFMDVLFIKTNGLYFDPIYARHMTDLCLLGIL